MADSLYIFGKHPVMEKLARNPKSIQKIFIKETMEENTLEDIKRTAFRAGVSFTLVPEKKLTDMLDGGVHQGLVAQVSPTEYVDLKDWVKTVSDVSNPCVILLDELEDPHNVGAIIRTAVACGVNGIIIPKHRQAQISGVIYKTSAGLVDQIPIIRVTNVNEAIRTLKDNKFWIVGLDHTANESIWTQDLDMATCFVVGSEGEGMRQKTGELCDFLVRIPMEKNVESLNASVSAALVMYEWKRRRSK